MLYKVLPWVGHYQTRTKGTICGSIAHADPSSEIPLCFAMLNGKIKLRSMKQTRVIEAREFQTGMLSTACKPNEIIESVLFPILDNKVGVAFNEFSFRKGDFSLLSVAVVYKKEAFYGDQLTIKIAVSELYNYGFELIKQYITDKTLNSNSSPIQNIHMRRRNTNIDHISDINAKLDLAGHDVSILLTLTKQ